MTLLALAGCASTPPQDTTALAVSGDEIGRYWAPETDSIKLVNRVRRTRPGQQRPLAQRVTVSYLIGSDGEVRDARVLAAEPAGASAEWAVDAVSAFSYRPTAANPERTPVRRTHIVTMGAAPGAATHEP